nr:maleylacetate reductase [Propylenella binzhouense]
MPGRVRFGSGTLDTLGTVLDELDCSRAFLIATPHHVAKAEALRASLGDRIAEIFREPAMHTPVAVTAAAHERVAAAGADCLVALGGGSAIGLGKALALRTGLAQIAVPTTYAGSEATPILGETEGGRKTTRRLPALLPDAIIYDVDLTLSLPPRLSANSGLNAMAHAVEALYARDGNPVISLLAEEAIRRMAGALPAIDAAPGDRDARADALYAAWLCGMALGSVGMALHHKLCHVLGGSFDLPHAETHAVLLPYSARYNAPAAPEAMERIARALGTADAPGGLFALARRVGAPASLGALGFGAEDVRNAVEITLAAPYWNPRPLEEHALLRLLEAARTGAPPEAAA